MAPPSFSQSNELNMHGDGCIWKELQFIAPQNKTSLSSIQQRFVSQLNLLFLYACMGVLCTMHTHMLNMLKDELTSTYRH